MLDKIRKYIDRHHLLNTQNLHLVALSGGADSVCLLRVMLQLGYKVHAAHCNFHLRGEESLRDENFCKTLCDKLGVTLHIAHFDTITYAKLHKVSIEMAARDLRYAYFEQLRVAIEADDILVAHHKDDNVETVIMNLTRGTGLNGLLGIKPRNGNIIRPMLQVTREDIINYLEILKQDYVTDSSNLVDDVMRNKIRLNVIPLLKEINPAAIENISNTIENISEISKIVECAIDKSVKECTQKENGVVTISRHAIMSQASPEQTLFAILTEYGFSPQQIKQIHNNINVPSGRVWNSSTHTIASDRDNFIIFKTPDNDYGKTFTLPEEGTYNIYKEQVHILINKEQRPEDFVPSREKNYITLDADKVHFPLKIRKIIAGDRFRPYGMKGTKLVSDYLTDRKTNYIKRQQQLVVEDAEGDIIWLVGERTAQKVACCSNTINILHMRYISK